MCKLCSIIFSGLLFPLMTPNYRNCSWVDAGLMALDFDNPILNQASDLLGSNFVYRIGYWVNKIGRFESTKFVLYVAIYNSLGFIYLSTVEH